MLFGNHVAFLTGCFERGLGARRMERFPLNYIRGFDARRMERFPLNYIRGFDARRMERFPLNYTDKMLL